MKAELAVSRTLLHECRIASDKIHSDRKGRFVDCSRDDKGSPELASVIIEIGVTAIRLLAT